DTNFSRSETLNYSIPQIFDFPAISTATTTKLGTDEQFLSTSQGSALNSFASFLYGGIADQFQSQFFDKGGKRADNNFREFRAKELGLFFQDSYKLRPNLTLDFGLRWEWNGVPYERNGLLSNLIGQDPSGKEPTGQFVFQLVGKNSGTDNLLYKNDNNNFAPRFGFSYSPGFTSGFLAKLTGGPGKKAIRGGYGIYYDRIFGNLIGNARGNPPFQQD